jgi:hypothetical protein
MAGSLPLPRERFLRGVPLDTDVFSSRWTDSYRFSRSLILLLLLVVLDVKNFLILGTPGGSKARYALLLIPLAAILWVRLESSSTLVRTPSATDVPLALLILFLLPGTLSAQLATGGAVSTVLSMAMAGVAALLYLGTVQELSEDEALRLARLLTCVGLSYAAMAVLGYSGVAPFLVSGLAFRNAKLFLLAMGVAGAVALRWRLTFLVLVPATAIVFRAYPSATFLLAAFVGAVVLMLTRPGGGVGRLHALVLFVLGAGAVAMLNIDRTVAVASGYFSSVGKINNTVVRLGLWKAGLEKFAHSPVYGDGFYGPATVSVWISHPPYPPYRVQAPLHNDFLLLLANGGVIALGLFVFWIAGTNVSAFRRVTALSAEGRNHSAQFLRILLVGFDTWLCAALFNPLLQEIGTSAGLLVLYAMIMMVGRGSRADRAPPAPAREHRPLAPFRFVPRSFPGAER